jgi:hypothetical protein
MSDEPQQTHEPEPEHKSTVEKVKEAIDKKIESGENSKKIKDAAIHAKESIKHAAENPRETANDIAKKATAAVKDAPRRAQQAVFDADSRYGKQSLTDTIFGAAGSDSVGGTFRKGVGRTVQGREQYDYDQAHPQEKGRPKSSPMMGTGNYDVMPGFGTPRRTSATAPLRGYGNFGFSAGAPVNFGGIGGQRQNPISFGFQRMSLPSFGTQPGARPPQYGGGMGFGIGFGLPRAAGTGTSNNSPFGGRFSLPLGKISKEKGKNGNSKISNLELIGSGKLNIFGRKVK